MNLIYISNQFISKRLLFRAENNQIYVSQLPTPSHENGHLEVTKTGCGGGFLSMPHRMSP
ncbi:hypothetical protein O23A_p0017 [Aeromonas salmonicida]|nr:hypothetical protein O23A_p0017 [Aeromonas salmonicida]